MKLSIRALSSGLRAFAFAVSTMTCRPQGQHGPAMHGQDGSGSAWVPNLPFAWMVAYDSSKHLAGESMHAMRAQTRCMRDGKGGLRVLLLV
jgi:hypothetical protein